MGRYSRLFLLLALAVAVALLGTSYWPKEPANAIPAVVLRAMENAEQFELMSLEPGLDRPGGQEFCGYSVARKVTISNQDARRTVIDALKRGSEEFDGTVIGCFTARHGIRVAHDGNIIDLLISYQARTTWVRVNEKHVAGVGFHTSESPRPILEKLMADVVANKADAK